MQAKVIEPPTVMSNGSDPALLGKIRIVVEAIYNTIPVFEKGNT